MNPTDAISWISSICTSPRRSRAKTLSQIVAAALNVTRASLAQLGRSLRDHSGVAAKHCIKRVERFIAACRPACRQAGQAGAIHVSNRSRPCRV